MKNTTRQFQMGNTLARKETPVLEIDQRLAELSRLYLERFKVMRTGTPADVQKITDQIIDIKIQLHQL